MTRVMVFMVVADRHELSSPSRRARAPLRHARQRTNHASMLVRARVPCRQSCVCCLPARGASCQTACGCAATSTCCYWVIRPPPNHRSVGRGTGAMLSRTGTAWLLPSPLRPCRCRFLPLLVLQFLKFAEKVAPVGETSYLSRDATHHRCGCCGTRPTHHHNRLCRHAALCLQASTPAARAPPPLV